MAVFVVGSLLLLAMAGYSDAAYCVCKSGLSDNVLQDNIDYACGAGADCTQIQPNGPCYNPSTVRDHCNYAVNSYFQKKSQTGGSCDFQGTATVTQNAPTASNGCVYPTSPSTGGTPTTGPPAGGTPTFGPPTTGGTPTFGPPTTSGTPTFGPPTTGGTPTIGTGATPTTGTPTPGGTPNFGGTTMNPGFGLGPTASGFPSTDNSAGVTLLSQNASFKSFVILISGIICARI